MLCEPSLCTGCRACENKCPTHALSMVEDREGFLRPMINEEVCNRCGLCEETCPVIKSPAYRTDEPAAFACWSLDEEIRIKSSSGGVFTLLAKEFLKDGGVVFGASFDDNLKLRHSYIEDYEAIDGLRRSKYVQSDTGHCYRETEGFLKEKRPVLFVGSPCQVGGLVRYLNKPYKNLLTISFVCYGVPSPGVFLRYVDLKEREHGSKIRFLSFREKQEHGWAHCAMRIDFENGTSDIGPLQANPYYVGFGRNLFTRPSCFQCPFRYPNSPSDLTLGDFWGADRLQGLKVKDDKGVSLVMIHTPKGEKWFKRIVPQLFIQRRSLNEALEFNPKIRTSAAMPERRSQFFAEFADGVPFDQLIERYMKNTGWKAETKKKIKALLGEGLINRFRR